MNKTPDPMTADAKSESLESWAVLDLFGHEKIVGLVTTRKFGSDVMFQVDVPAADAGGFAYSKLINPKAVFAIQPTNEEWCRKWACHAAKYNRAVLPYIPEPSNPSGLLESGAAGYEDNEGECK